MIMLNADMKIQETQRSYSFGWYGRLTWVIEERFKVSRNEW